LIEIIWLRKYLFVKVYLVDYGRNYYAMKVLRKNIVLEGQDLAYVMLERDVLIQSQSNPFIIQLIYAFQNAERLFFLMEVAKGGNFYRLLIKQAPRPFRYERIVFHSGEIACALSFLHSKRIVCLKSSLKTIFIRLLFIGLS
jgi:serine/threonine protein kinase